LARWSSSALQLARRQLAPTLAPCCLNAGDWEPEGEEAGEHLLPGGPGGAGAGGAGGAGGAAGACGGAGGAGGGAGAAW